MKASVRLGRIWNIPIGLSTSWFLIFGLVTWSLATGIFPATVPGLNSGVYWLLGAVTSILFFGSVLAHELGHAFFALRNGVPVRAITLFFFGGVAEITREPKSAGAEFRIAIAGPLVSLALAGLFASLASAVQGIATFEGPALWLARINLTLALFNMLPGFPLDGGRVLRSIIWRVTGDEFRATTVASGVGQVVAFGFIGVGIFSALTGNFANGLWLVFLGFFLNSAAAGTRQQVSAQKALRGLTAGQLMSRAALRVPSWVTVGDALDPTTLSQGHRAFLVQDFGQFRGLLTLDGAARVPRSKWTQTKIEQVMIPREKLLTITAETEVLAALQAMDEAGIDHVPVLDPAGGDALGLLARSQVAAYLRAEAELASQTARSRGRSPAPNEG
jgi:Zn-dependent protease